MARDLTVYLQAEVAGTLRQEDSGRLTFTYARECLERRPARVLRARALCTLGLALGLDEAGDRDAAEEALLESIALCERLVSMFHLAHLNLDFRGEQVRPCKVVDMRDPGCMPRDGSVTSKQEDIRGTIRRQDAQAAHHRVRKTARHHRCPTGQFPSFHQGLDALRIFGQTGRDRHDVFVDMPVGQLARVSEKTMVRLVLVFAFLVGVYAELRVGFSGRLDKNQQR